MGQAPEPVAGRDRFAAPAHHQEHRAILQPASEVGDGVEGGLVSSMGVVEDDYPGDDPRHAAATTAATPSSSRT